MSSKEMNRKNVHFANDPVLEDDSDAHPERNNEPSDCQEDDSRRPGPRPSLQRAGTHVDFSTGRPTLRCQRVRVVKNCKTAASKWTKRNETFWKRFKTVNTTLEQEQESNDETDTTPDKIYRLQAATQKGKTRRPGMSWVSEYLRWTFRATFAEVIAVTCVGFVALICFFALLTLWIGVYRPKCIAIAGFEFDDSRVTSFGTKFMIAFHLSWTTLSTVGYGVVYPQTPLAKTRCIGVNALMAAEAFVGVLFGSVVGAIIFGKVARVQSIALVKFSDPLCIRYGTECAADKKDICSDSDTDEETATTTAEEKDLQQDNIRLSCPILEFRLINNFSKTKGGEIMDARINVVATKLAKDDLAELDLADLDYVMNERAAKAEKEKRRTTFIEKDGAAVRETGMAADKALEKGGKLLEKGAMEAVGKTSSLAKHTGSTLLNFGRNASHATGSLLQRLNHSITRPSGADIPGVETEEEPYEMSELKKELEEEFHQRFKDQLKESQTSSFLKMQRSAIAVDEGNSPLVPRRIFYKLDLLTDSLPFFRRVWNLRHRLDANSPLLSAQARRMIEENQGRWPDSLNDHASIRKHVHFEEIIVSFAGTSYASGNSVFSQHVYDYCNVNVGYTFVPILRFNDRGTLVVDEELVNDVKEQDSGGAEPFFDSVISERAAMAIAVHRADEKAHVVASALLDKIAAGEADVPMAKKLSKELDVQAVGDRSLVMHQDVEQGFKQLFTSGTSISQMRRNHHLVSEL